MINPGRKVDEVLVFDWDLYLDVSDVSEGYFIYLNQSDSLIFRLIVEGYTVELSIKEKKLYEKYDEYHLVVEITPQMGLWTHIFEAPEDGRYVINFDNGIGKISNLEGNCTLSL